MTKQNKIESGRSMVEMLGVLAVIGVLSVGGIAGYKYAMKKHQLNEFFNSLSIVVMNQQSVIQKLEELAATDKSDEYYTLRDNIFEQDADLLLKNPLVDSVDRNGGYRDGKIDYHSYRIDLDIEPNVEMVSNLRTFIDNGLVNKIDFIYMSISDTPDDIEHWSDIFEGRTSTFMDIYFVGE